MPETKVYVLETGDYDSHGIAGVYSTPEKAMAAWPKGPWHSVSWGWVNGLIGDRAASVTAFTLDPERPYA